MGRFPDGHPIRSSLWRWPENYCDLHNHFAQFRWDFTLASVPSAVPFWITADKAYRLFVNGTPVCRGPARGYQRSWPVDEVDVAPYLKPGANWISVEAYQPGRSTFQYLHEAYAGLLVACAEPILENARFAMRRSPGHRRDTQRLSLQLDYQEHLDLRLDDRTWITGEAPPEGWSPAIHPPAAQLFTEVRFGRAPWYDVEERGIPLLREGWKTPELPTVCASGRGAPDAAETKNPSWSWIEEARRVTDWRPAKGRHEDGWVVVDIPPTGKDGFHAVVVPLDEIVAGTLAVEVEGASGGELLDFQHDQFFRDGKWHGLEPGAGCMVALCNRLILRPGDNAHEFFHLLGFGVVTLIARRVAQPIRVRLRVRTLGYPFEMRGDFSCSDDDLNTIYAACRRTQQACSLDAYVDTPWREQAQWWGDARVQGRNTFYLDGDARLLERGIRSLAGQNVSGLIPGHAPTSSYFCVLPDFALTLIITLWDHYWQTGSTRLFEEFLPRAREILAYFDTPEARHPSGLLRYDARFWLFEDWSNLPKEPIPTFLNLWYVATLQHLGRLARAAGAPDEWSERAQNHLALVVRHAFNRDRDCFWPVLDLDLKPFGEPSVHDQTLALMVGVPGLSEDHLMQTVVLPYLRGEPLSGAHPSAFWATHLLELAISRGYVREAVEFIRRQWMPMMATRSTWENFDWHEEAGESACHSWTAHPSFHFVNGIAGLTQTGPGWSSVAWNPEPLGMARVEARVPAPVGDLDVRIEGGEASLSVPSTVAVSSRHPLTPAIDEDRTVYRISL